MKQLDQELSGSNGSNISSSWYLQLFFWSPEHVELANVAALKPRTHRACQFFRSSRVCPGQISKGIKGDYVLSGTQKPPTFLFWYVAWEEHQLVFCPLCSLGCLLLYPPVHGSSLLLLLSVNAISILAWGSHQPGDYADGDMQAQSPPLWNSDSANTSQPVEGQAFQMQSYSREKTNGGDTKTWKMVQFLKFLLVLILKTRAVCFLLLSCAQSCIYIYIRWAAHLVRGLFVDVIKVLVSVSTNYFWKKFQVKAYVITCSVGPKVLLLFHNKI